MTKTKIQKILAVVGLFALATANFSAVHAAVKIGTGSVTGSGAFDADIMWNETFTANSASGSVQNIIIKARVNPTLNMEVSTGAINLGDLIAGTASTGSLFIEIGTNAKSGVSITARSQSGGLTHTSSGAIQINNDGTDGVTGESYTYASTPNATDDSASPAFSATGLSTAVEVNDNSTEHTIYSTNKSETSSAAINDVEFVVSATSAVETPAGDYEDFVTFTVTGNF